MKRKNWKRTAAFVTSMAMSTTMLPGELSTVLVQSVNAAETEVVSFNWNGTKYNSRDTYIKSLKINGENQTNLISNKDMDILAGSKVELVSSVPLKFWIGENNENKIINNLAIGDSEAYEHYVYNVEQKLFINNTDENARNMTAEELAEALLEEAGYDVDTDETFTKNSEWDVNHTQLTVNFYAKETVKDGNYTYTFVMPADNDGTADDKLSVAAIEQSCVVTYYSSEANRTHKNGSVADPIEWNDGEGEGKDGNAFGNNGYFYGLTIASKDDSTEKTKTVLNSLDAEPKNQILGDTVTVTCANPFVIHVNDNDATVNWINPDITYDSEKKVFKTSFTMPKSKTGAPVQIDVVKINEEYSYTTKNSKLLATTKSGSIKNAEAAGIVAKYYNSKIDAADFGEDDDKGTVVSGAVPNGKYVVIGVTASDKLVTVGDDAVKIKKGNTILTNAYNDADDELEKLGEDKYLISKNAGSYSVTFTVKGNDKKDYEVTYSFNIDAKSALTAENVTLEFSAKKDKVPVNFAADKIMADNQNLDDLTVKPGQTATYMIASGKAADVQKAGYQFTVTPTLYSDTEHADENELQVKDAEHSAEGKYDYYVEGNPSGSKLGNTYTFTIYITNPEYGGSEENPKTITMTWEVVDYESVPRWENCLLKDGKGVNASIDAIEELEDTVFNAAIPNDAAKAAKANNEVRYQWIEGSGAVRTKEMQDELDEFHDDLPTEMGDYTVYIIYKDVVQSTVNVRISKYALNIFADESDLTYTYGKKLELKKDTIQKNSKGEAVNIDVSDLTCTIWSVAKNADDELLMNVVNENGVAQPPKAWDGVNVNDLMTNVCVYDDGLVKNAPQLEAGTYVVTFGGTIDSEDYTVLNNKRQLLVVNKKQITDKSLVIMVDPFTYNGQQRDVVKDGAFTVRDTDFESNDPRYNVSAKFKMTEGGKRTAAGTYDCTFKLVSNAEANYEGNAVDSNWYITHNEATAVDAGLKWDDKRSTLYDNGRIHVEITRNADDKIRDDKEVAKIAKFGVLFDKVGKLAAPEEYGVDYSKPNNQLSLSAQREKQIAEKMLQYGNKAFGEGGYTKTTSVTCASQTYKANIEVSDVDTGMWLRPYILYEDGTVSYGDVKYLDLTHEAINKLGLDIAEVGEGGKATRKADLTAAQTKTLAKTKQYVKSGYNVAENKFYVYTSYTDLETAGFTNVAQVADFGIVVDRNGAIDELPVAPVEPDVSDYDNDDQNLDYLAAVAAYNEDVKAYNAAIEAVDKTLRIDTKGLVVGHYKKDNPVLKENEYAASIKLGNSATGCWVRPYIDLGNGLVIYADPIYINSASEYYTEGAAGILTTKWENANYQRLILTHDVPAANRIHNVAVKAGVEDSDVEVVKTGVVADKKNLLDKPNKMILGAGFIDGKKSSGFDAAYTAKLSPKDENDVSVRTYTVYNIKGVEVTVYGAVTTYKYSETSKRVVAVVGNPDEQIQIQP